MEISNEFLIIIGLAIMLPNFYIWSLIKLPIFLVVLSLLGIIFGLFFFAIGTMPKNIKKRYVLDEVENGK